MGSIRFIGYGHIDLEHRAKFKKLESQNVDEVSKILFETWKIRSPKLIISFNSGLDEINYRTIQIKKLENDLIDIVRETDSLILGCGLNYGGHKVVSNMAYEYRTEESNNPHKVALIGICSWDDVLNNNSLLPNSQKNIEDKNNPLFHYQYKMSFTGKPYSLDSLYDCFLFGDDNINDSNEEDVMFQTKLQKYIAKKYLAMSVHILFQGDKQSLRMAYNFVKNKVPMIIVKGSGGVADLLSRTLELSAKLTADEIALAIDKIVSTFQADERIYLKTILIDFNQNYKNKIVIHDMYNPDVKLRDHFLTIIQSECRGQSLGEILNFTIGINCADIANSMVFMSPNFTTIASDCMKKSVMDVLKNNQFEFVSLFMLNGFEIESVLTEGDLEELYQTIKESHCFESLKTKPKSKLLDQVQTIAPMLSTGILKPYIHENEGSHIDSWDLLLWALVCGRTEVAHIIWETEKNDVKGALVTSIILMKLSQLTKEFGDMNLHRKLKSASDDFEILATKIMDLTYERNKERTIHLLMNKPKKNNKIWQNVSCIEIAIIGELMLFLNSSACRSYANKIWIGNMWDLSLCKSEDSADNKADKCAHVKKAVNSFCEAPFVKYWIYLICYVLFLVFFSYVNLSTLHYTRNAKEMWAEYVVYVFVFSLAIEEIYQVFNRSGSVNFSVRAYWRSSWNKYDTILISLFIASVIIRYTVNEHLFEYCRCAYALSLSMFYIRIMQYCVISEYIGPKVIMLRRMLVDIIFFLIIFGIFILSYGTMSQSLINPNNNITASLFKNLVYMPYFNTYGELMLDQMKPMEKNSSYIREGAALMGFAVFLLFNNIVLINLLIGLFGFTINKINQESEKYWSFLNIQLIDEISKKSIIPPPFNILYYLPKLVIIILFDKCIPYFQNYRRHRNKRNTTKENIAMSTPGNQNVPAEKETENLLV